MKRQVKKTILSRKTNSEVKTQVSNVKTICPWETMKAKFMLPFLALKQQSLTRLRARRESQGLSQVPVMPTAKSRHKANVKIV